MTLSALAEDLRSLRAVIQKHSLLSSINIFRGLNLTALEVSDPELLKKQALELRSFPLGLAIEAYQAAHSEQFTHSQIAQIAQWCLLSGRFKDLLDFQEYYPSVDATILSASLQAAYRLSDWSRAAKTGNLLSLSEQTFSSISLIVRSLLELDQFSEAFDLLETLTPQSAEEERRKELLVLLSRFRGGLATFNDANRFLERIEGLDQVELSCFLRYLSISASFLNPSVVRERVYPFALLASQRLRGAKIYTGPYGLLPSTKAVHDGQNQSIAFVYPHLSTKGLNQADALSAVIRGIAPQVTVTYVALDADEDVIALERDDILICIRQTSLELLDQLRQHSFDVLIDRIGIRYANWMLALSQRIAPLQLLWSDSPVDYLSESSPYDAQLADRWTTPSDQEAGTLPWLTLTGTRQLSRLQADASKLHRSNHPAVTFNRSELLVLGAPDQMLPGAAVLLQRLLKETSVQRLVMTDRAFQDKLFLEHWWQFWNPQDQVVNLDYCNLDSINQIREVQLIAVDLCLESPCNAVLECLESWIPVVHLSTADFMGSKGTVSILSALGLESLARTNPEDLIEVVQVLSDIEDPTYHQIAHSMLENLPNSLLCDYQLFASDLLESIRVARGPKCVLTS